MGCAGGVDPAADLGLAAAEEALDPTSFAWSSVCRQT
jgi:hypothetical protein